jgi:hypothetical protein
MVFPAWAFIHDVTSPPPIMIFTSGYFFLIYPVMAKAGIACSEKSGICYEPVIMGCNCIPEKGIKGALFKCLLRLQKIAASYRGKVVILVVP